MNGKFVLVILKAKEKKVKLSQGNTQINGILLSTIKNYNKKVREFLSLLPLVFDRTGWPRRMKFF